MDMRTKLGSARAESEKLEEAKKLVKEDSRKLIAQIEELKSELSGGCHSAKDIKRKLFSARLVANELAKICKVNKKSTVADRECPVQEQKDLPNNVIELADGTGLLVNGYTFYFPQRILSVKIKPNSTKPCPGCDMSLPAFGRSTRSNIASLEFYRHVFDCAKFLGETWTCEECKLIFVEKTMLGKHVKQRHDHRWAHKPNWMQQTLYKKSSFKLSSKTSVFGKISCVGCKKIFITKKQGPKFHPELKYYVHCAEACEEYKEKGFIRTCEACDLKFFSLSALQVHASASGHEIREDEPVRDWMAKVLKLPRRGRVYDSTVNCRGCGKEFLSKNNCFSGITKKLPQRAYFIHCIEECEEYRQLDLVRTCKKCKCKFINSRAMDLHVCN